MHFAVIEALTPFLSNPNSALEVLDLGQNKLSDKAAQQIAEALNGNSASNLRTLALNSNKIGTKGAIILSEVNRLCDNNWIARITPTSIAIGSPR